jgi:membrane associated rhomboid family serine protease
VVRRTESRSRAEEWSFVLRALGVIHEIRDDESGYSIAVLEEDREQASAALEAHERERAEPPPPPPPEYGPSRIGWGFAAFILAVHLATGPRDPSVIWFARGSLEAEAVLRGEWWRIVTALSLHADLEHALGNALIGALLLSALARRIGTAAAAWLALLAGAAGNALTAVVARSHYASVGASTAVFAALSALAVVEALSRRRAAAVALGAGAALLGFLGTGQQADLLAHLFGFVAGALGALLSAPHARRPPRRTSVQPAFALAALAAVAACWWRAVR